MRTKLKRSLSLLLALGMVMGLLCGNAWAVETEKTKDAAPTTMEASGTCGDNVTWTLDDSGTLTIRGTGPMGDYAASNKEPWYIYQDEITSVVVTSGVTAIGKYAFSKCSDLYDVTIEDGVKSIGSSAFEGCSRLTTVTMAKTVEVIEEKAFFDCEELSKAYYGGTRADWRKIAIGSDNDPLMEAERYCEPATSGQCGENLNWNFENDTLTITGTGDMEFSEELAPWEELDYQNVVIEDGVTSIADGAFCYAYLLKRVTIPASVAKIGEDALAECSNLVDISVDAGNKVYCSEDGVLLNKEKTELLVYPQSKATETYTVPNGVKSIGESLFHRCYNLVHVFLPGSVTSIGDWAFDGCESLKTITIPTSVTYIGEGAFAFCDSMTDIYYAGSESKWRKIDFSGADSDEIFTSVAIHYNGSRKALNKITASNKTKVTSTKAQTFTLGAKALDGAKLTYKTNNKSVKVDAKGKVTIAKKFVGQATITITAAETKKYDPASKKVTVTVIPTGTKLTSVKSAKTGQMTIKWAKNAAVTGYQVQYATSSKFTGAKTLNVKSNKTVTSTLSKLKQKQKYYVRIRTYKTVGKVNYYSAWSAAKSATVKGATAPAAVKLTSVKSAKAGEMTVKWGKNAKAGGYQLQYAAASNFKGAKAVTVKKAATTSTTIKKLTKGKKYYVRVRTYQKVGSKTYYSAWSASKNVTIKK